LTRRFSTCQRKQSPTGRRTQPIDQNGGIRWYNHPGLAPAEKWPGDDWIDQPTLAPVAAALKTWAIQKKQMTDVDFDITRNSQKELYRSYRTALFKALFTGRFV